MRSVFILLLVLLSVAVAQDCFLKVPDKPLGAEGLSTPYLLSGAGCDETSTASSVFVEAIILDPHTGVLQLYSPLVINAADPHPAVTPTVPVITHDQVVALFFGANTNSLTLTGSTHGCINGNDRTIFGQVAFCNADRFFDDVDHSLRLRKLDVPRLGNGTDGVPCPTTRSFAVVDQDQSDNVETSYLIIVLPDGKTRLAQNTAANREKYPNATVNDNGSDNALLGAFILPALGCPVWKVQDISDTRNGTYRGSQAMNEIQANLYATAPIALIPAGDEMVQVDGQSSLERINAYRVQVDQPEARHLSDANTTTYCVNLIGPSGLAAIVSQRPHTRVFPSVDPAAGTNLFTFLAQRLAASYTLLDCPALLGVENPVDLVTNADGVCTGARFFGSSTVLD